MSFEAILFAFCTPLANCCSSAKSLIYGEYAHYGGYHYYPTDEQVHAWLADTPFILLEVMEGNEYRHYLTRKERVMGTVYDEPNLPEEPSRSQIPIRPRRGSRRKILTGTWGWPRQPWERWWS